MEIVVERKGNKVVMERDTSVYGIRMSDGQLKKVHATKDGYVDNEGNVFKSIFTAPMGIDLLIIRGIKDEVIENQRRDSKRS